MSVNVLEKELPPQSEAVFQEKSTVVSVRNLSVSFKKQPVFNDISFDIFQGEVVAILGSNGAGKSTLLKSLVKLVDVNQGSIECLTHSVTGLRNKKLRKFRSQIGFVFQKHQLVPRLTALSNVLHGSLASSGFKSWFHWMAPSPQRIKALQALDSVGLKSKALQSADSLSGGQSQRVAIARTLMQNPSIIFADEPAASLDPKAGNEIMELLTRLCRSRQTTTLFVTHNLEHALQYADRVLGIKNGELLIDESVSALTVDELKELF